MDKILGGRTGCGMCGPSFFRVLLPGLLAFSRRPAENKLLVARELGGGGPLSLRQRLHSVGEGSNLQGTAREPSPRTPAVGPRAQMFLGTRHAGLVLSVTFRNVEWR